LSQPVKPRKAPLRKCVVSGERLEKKELLRIVKTKDHEFFVDLTGKANGRGAYIKKDKTVILKAQKTKLLTKVFDHPVPDSIYEELLNTL
jgi:predicted RNA-binding protein YlxR (DUF448 family)